jgi:hypothetical protein
VSVILEMCVFLGFRSLRDWLGVGSLESLCLKN